MRVGQIIRITKFGTWHSGTNACTGSIWARIVRINDDPRRNVADVEFIAADHDCAEYISNNDWAPQEWDLDSNDRWEKVPPSKVPNWVWVEQAKRNLTGAIK